jgi:hypothetical protein
VSFIMRDRLTHVNLQENSKANYMFIENGPGIDGIRVNLEKVGGSEDQKKIANLSKRNPTSGNDDENRFLLSF